MDKLFVSPEYLERLAENQDGAQKTLGDAASEPSDTGYQVWITHGVICGASAQAITNAVEVRTHAVKNTQAVSTHLAEMLRKAKAAYEVTDSQAAENLDSQGPSENRYQTTTSGPCYRTITSPNFVDAATDLLWDYTRTHGRNRT